jgi:acyl-CoA dehydrogenase
MEVLSLFGTPEQKERWLKPLLAAEIRSSFAMTEPDVASSDARNITTSIRRDGDGYVVSGRKWWTTGAADPRCAVLVVMGRTDPAADAHRQQSMVLVPMDAPGVTLVRSLPVFGYHDQHGHGEIVLDDVRVPVGNLLGGEGDGFAIAQARLGPGRVHHCMRLVGLAEMALDRAVRRATTRTAFGRPLAKLGGNAERIADARIAIDQARLLVLHAAWKLDTTGPGGALSEVSQIKVAVPNMAQQVIDMAMQMHGGGGFDEALPLAAAWVSARSLRMADGPDEVHRGVIAKLELAKHR